jgi:hypothetical protein
MMAAVTRFLPLKHLFAGEKPKISTAFLTTSKLPK